MSYLFEIGRETPAQSILQTSLQTFLAATPQSSNKDARRQNPKQNNPGLRAIKKEIKALIEEAKQATHGRVETVLERLLESLIEARRQRVNQTLKIPTLAHVHLVRDGNSIAEIKRLSQISRRD